MTELSLAHIYQEGDILSHDERVTIYLTKDTPLKYDVNKWRYHKMPSFSEWKMDLKKQYDMHMAQGSPHLAFDFPPNVKLTDTFKAEALKRGFEVGYIEMYAIEPADLISDTQKHVEIQEVTEETIEDYIMVHKRFALPYGKDYMLESSQMIRDTFGDNPLKHLVIAYVDQQPVGILDMFIQKETIEIDGFGVTEDMRHQGIGRAMQAYVAKRAKARTIILVADGEDTAKDMYVKQGYTFIGYRYQILKENIQ